MAEIIPFGHLIKVRAEKSESIKQDILKLLTENKDVFIDDDFNNIKRTINKLTLKTDFATLQKLNKLIHKAIMIKKLQDSGLSRTDNSFPTRDPSLIWNETITDIEKIINKYTGKDKIYREYIE